jgi:hypothetical protein
MQRTAGTLSFDFDEAGEDKLAAAIVARLKLTSEARKISEVFASQNSEYVLYVVPLAGKTRARVAAPTGEMEWLKGCRNTLLKAGETDQNFFI